MSKGTAEDAARATLRVVPLVMQTIRGELRASRAIPISVPQFRALHFVGRHPETSLSAVAAQVGVTLPSMSRLVDGLVERELVTRNGDGVDRRRMTLRLTAPGQELVRVAHALAEEAMAARLSVLTEDERTGVVRAMDLVYRVFSDGTTRNVDDRVGKERTGDQHA